MNFLRTFKVLWCLKQHQMYRKTTLNIGHKTAAELPTKLPAKLPTTLPMTLPKVAKASKVSWPP
jgi:hypothetical protein